MSSNSMVWLTGLVLVFVGSGGPTSAQTSTRREVEAANGRFSAAVAGGRAADLASTYTPDGKVFPPGAEVVQSHPAIQQMWQGVMDSGIKGLVLTTVDVEAEGDLAYESGRDRTRCPSGRTGRVTGSPSRPSGGTATPSRDAIPA